VYPHRVICLLIRRLIARPPVRRRHHTTIPQDGRAYIGGFEGYKGRKGLGFTVTKVGKGLIADREGSKQIGAGLIIDFTAQTYRKTSASGGEEPEVSMAGAAAAAQAKGKGKGKGKGKEEAAVAVPDFWDEAAVYALLRAAVEDPAGHWAAVTQFTQALRDEQARLLHEEPPRVPIPSYSKEGEASVLTD